MRVRLTNLFRGFIDYLGGARLKLVPVRCLTRYKRGVLDASQKRDLF